MSDNGDDDDDDDDDNDDDDDDDDDSKIEGLLLGLPQVLLCSPRKTCHFA